MSFKINNNINALRSYNDVSNVTMEMNKSMGRLSKGLRIAEASDDPSGLISSETFRAQISSIDAAIRNNQEGVNYAKTAENALGEMNKLLNEARGLAVASGNSATLSASQLAANQDQINGIIGAINRVAGTTSYGNRKLLDGSAGTSTQISNGAKVSGWSFGGQHGAVTVTANGLATINQTALATRALYTSTAGGGLATGARNTGTVAINGVSFNISIGATGASMAAQFNAASGQTGVTATFNTTSNNLEFSHTKTGTNNTITFTDTSGVISAAANTQASTAGVNAVASIQMAGATVLYTGGLQGVDGLTLRDASGNTLNISDGGNATGTSLLGRVTAGESRFQIGGQAGNTANLALRNMAASQLGTGVVAGQTLASVDVTTATGAGNALSVIDKAIEEVTQTRGRIGNFQRNTLESNNRVLASMKENISNSESSIRDLDVADEMTKFTKWQVMQQAGMSMLSQANQSSQGVLSLLR
jgi:flagellin